MKSIWIRARYSNRSKSFNEGFHGPVLASILRQHSVADRQPVFKAYQWLSTYAIHNACTLHIYILIIAILDFYPPQIPAYLSISKHISPHLKSSYTLGLPAEHSISFLYSSVPISTVDRRLSEEFKRNHLIFSRDTLQQGLRGSMRGELKMVPEQDTGSTIHKRQLLVYGRLFEDYRMEYLYSHRLRSNMLMTLSGVSSLHQSDAFASLLDYYQYYLIITVYRYTGNCKGQRELIRLNWVLSLLTLCWAYAISGPSIPTGP